MLGIGSYTYQYKSRDTFGFAIKATYGVVNNEPREIFKAPKTDGGEKKSAKGLLCVNQEDGQLVLHDQQTQLPVTGDQMRMVFLNGHLPSPVTFTTIRNRLNPKF